MSQYIYPGLGWIPDLPDARDYDYRHPEVLRLLQKLKPACCTQLPTAVDLRADCDVQYILPPEDQGQLNASPAFAVLALAEYFERRAAGRAFNGSKLFLYRVTCNRLRHTGASGVDLRTTMKMLATFGVPPEEHWPYDPDRFDQEPNAFLYGLAKAFPKVYYLRLDQPARNGSQTLVTIKSFLAAGFPVAFGFSVPTALTSDPGVPYRKGFNGVRGGQAVVAVGYQDDGSLPGRQAILFRNSWGRTWGDAGYGWLPYAYIRDYMARDFWTLVSDAWMDSSEFSRPTVIDKSHTETEGAGSELSSLL
jgi:C1A family cysteine protease